MDHAGIHGGSLGKVSELRDFRNLPCGFDDRTGACSEVHAGMRGFAADGDEVVADAFAGSLQLALGARARLEHQHCFALARGLLRQRTRRFAAHFLIGIELQNDLARHRNIEIPQRAHGEDKECEAAFHVDDAGSPQRVCFGAERRRLQRSQRIHRVGMAEPEDLACALLHLAGQPELDAQVFTEGLSAREEFYIGGDIRHAVGEEFPEAVHGRGIIAWRLAFDEFANEINDVSLFGLGVSEYRVHLQSCYRETIPLRLTCQYSCEVLHT